MPDSAIRRLLEFDNQVQRDRDQNPVFLHRRDRRFALTATTRASARVRIGGLNMSGACPAVDRPMTR